MNAASRARRTRVAGIGPAAALALVVCLSAVLAWSSPREAGDLRPSPDAVEYALTAVGLSTHGSLDLHIGNLAAPPRYPFGMAVLAAPLLWLRSFGHAAQPYDAALVSMASGVVAVGALYLAGRRTFGIASGVLAAGLFATSPFFASYTRLIMAEMPSATMLCLAALVLTLPYGGPRRAVTNGALLGFLLAGSIMLRLANAQIAPALLLALLVAAGARRWRATLAFAAAAALGISPLLAYQWRAFGSPLRTGYHLWTPEWVNGTRPTFALTYAIGKPALPGFAVQSNFAHYLALWAGWPAFGDGGSPVPNPIHGSLAAPLGALAILGLWRALAERKRACVGGNSSERARLAVAPFAGVGVLSALAFYGPYYFQDVRYLMPWIPLWLLLSASGLVWLAQLPLQRMGSARFAISLQRVGMLLTVAFLALWTAGLPATVTASPAWQRSVKRHPAETPPRLTEVLALAVEAPEDAWIVSAIDGPFVDFYALRGSDRRYVPLARGLEFVDKPPFQAVPTAQDLHTQIAARVAAGGHVLIDRWSLEFAEGLPDYRTEMDKALAGFDLLPGGRYAPHEPAYYALAVPGPDHGLPSFSLREGEALRSSDGTVYVYRGGTKRHVLSLQALNSLGIGWEDVRRLPDRVVASIPEGEPLGAEG